MASFTLRRALCGLALLAVVAVAGPSLVRAELTKVEKRDGHVSPVLVELTYHNQETQKGLLCGFGNKFNYHTHIIRGFSPEQAQVDLWLDGLTSIDGVNGDEAVLTLKDGTQRQLRVTEDKNLLYFVTVEGTEQRIELSQVKSVKFLTSPRKDREGNPMFPQWKFSPFTGEKLPQE